MNRTPVWEEKACAAAFFFISLGLFFFFLSQKFLATVTEYRLIEERSQFTDGPFSGAKLQSRADERGDFLLTLEASDVHRCSGDAAVM